MKQNDRACIVINSFNYEAFVEAAAESALNQDGADIRVVVIDDGSTDASVSLLRSRFGDRLSIIEKPNNGQLSCFNEIPKLCSDDEIVFFLDADDYYEPGYIRAVLDIYNSRPDVDFVFSSPRFMGNTEGATWDMNIPKGDQGFSVIAALSGRRWIGAPTSCLSARAPLLRKFLPYEELDDWKTRADDVLVLGASALGARKYHAPIQSVCYRLHGANHFANVTMRLEDNFARELKLARLFRFLEERSGQVQDDPTILMLEFQALPEKSVQLLWRYTSYLAGMKASWGAKAHAMGSLVKTFVSPSRR